MKLWAAILDALMPSRVIEIIFPSGEWVEEWMDGEPAEGICLGGFLPARGDEVELA